MRQMIGLLLLTFAVQPTLAKENWPLTVKVLSTQNIENEHGSFRLAWGGGAGGAGWAHRIAEHAFIEASDGNSYELVPDNQKDMLLPGTYKARIEKRDMKICEPKDNGNCREVKFKVVAAVPISNAAELTSKRTGGAPTPAAVAPSAAPSSPASLPASASASLSIESNPPGGDIEMDGAFVGNTPSTVAVAPGSHQIAVKKKGFADWSKTLSVTGGTIHLNAELEQVPPKQ